MTWYGEMLVNSRVATGFIVDVLGYPVSEGCASLSNILFLVFVVLYEINNILCIVGYVTSYSKRFVGS